MLKVFNPVLIPEHGYNDPLFKRSIVIPSHGEAMASLPPFRQDLGRYRLA